MGDPTPPAARPTRRLVAMGALGGLVAALGGCGIRLEDDAPRVPLVPAREPIAGEAALLRLLDAVQVASQPAVGAPAPLAASLATLHRRQGEVLRDALRQRGVPASELPSASPSPTPSPSPSPSPSTTPSGPQAPTVAAVERSVVAAGEGCAEAEAELRPMLVALLAQSQAAIELATGGGAERPAPAPTWSAPELLVPLVRAMRRAVYLLEVAAARTPGRTQRAARDGIARLESVTAEVVEAAGTSAPAPELGHPLPQPVTTPAQARALAAQTWSTLLDAWGAELATLSAADPESAFADVPRWLGGVAAEAHRGGTPLTAFPGLR